MKRVGNKVACLIITQSHVSIEMVEGMAKDFNLTSMAAENVSTNS